MLLLCRFLFSSHLPQLNHISRDTFALHFDDNPILKLSFLKHTTGEEFTSQNSLSCKLDVSLPIVVNENVVNRAPICCGKVQSFNCI